VIFCCERNLEEVSSASAPRKFANDGALPHDQLSDKAAILLTFKERFGNSLCNAIDLNQGRIVDLGLGIVSSNERATTSRAYNTTERTRSEGRATEEFLHEINDRPVMVVHHEEHLWYDAEAVFCSHCQTRSATLRPYRHTLIAGLNCWPQIQRIAILGVKNAPRSRGRSLAHIEPNDSTNAAEKVSWTMPMARGRHENGRQGTLIVGFGDLLLA
jgi:hypothetical protein